MKTILNKYINGACSNEERAEVLKLLQAEKPSPELLEFMKCHWEILKSKTDLPGNDIDFNHLHDKIMRSVASSVGAKDHHIFDRKWYSLVSSIAALAFLILSVSLWVLGQRGLLLPEASYKVSSANGQTTYVLLPDSSEVWLHGNSSIQYATSYGVNDRTLNLEGEGYFKVIKNNDVPFVVQAGQVDVIALGTGFNVEENAEANLVKVTLKQGSIKVVSQVEEKILSPGMQALVTKDKMSVGFVDPDFYTSWRNGQLAFKDESLQDIIGQLSKIYKVDFEYRNQRLKSYRYRGVIPLDSSIETTLGKLKMYTGVNYRVDADKIVLYQ